MPRGQAPYDGLYQTSRRVGTGKGIKGKSAQRKYAKEVRKFARETYGDKNKPKHRQTWADRYGETTK